MPHRDPERRRAYGREWMRLNAAKAREAMRRWRAAHREVDRLRKRDHYAANSERLIARSVEYARQHPDVVRALRHKRRGRELEAEGSFTAEEWRQLKADYEQRCGYCGLEKPLEPDHRVPLVRGGSNLIANIIPSCRSCNSRKYRLTEQEFRVRLANERWRSTEFEVVDWWPAREIEWVS